MINGKCVNSNENKLVWILVSQQKFFCKYTKLNNYNYDYIGFIISHSIAGDKFGSHVKLLPGFGVTRPAAKMTSLIPS